MEELGEGKNTSTSGYWSSSGAGEVREDDFIHGLRVEEDSPIGNLAVDIK